MGAPSLKSSSVELASMSWMEETVEREITDNRAGLVTGLCISAVRDDVIERSARANIYMKLKKLDAERRCEGSAKGDPGQRDGTLPARDQRKENDEFRLRSPAGKGEAGSLSGPMRFLD